MLPDKGKFSWGGFNEFVGPIAPYATSEPPIAQRIHRTIQADFFIFYKKPSFQYNQTIFSVQLVSGMRRQQSPPHSVSRSTIRYVSNPSSHSVCVAPYVVSATQRPVPASVHPVAA
eukprot:3941100-Rhodomonas_salina.1